MARKVKEALVRCCSCWFLLSIAHLTYRFSDGCWLVQSFIRIFPMERLHHTEKIWLVLIICLVIIFSYYHLVSLHGKNRYPYLLGTSQWLHLQDIHTKSRTFVTIPSYLLKHCLAVHVIMSEHAILELVNSVSDSFEYDKFTLGIFII